ncbi:MAG: DUF4383 domain-containing protein [Vicinamibacterales bacterium]
MRRAYVAMGAALMFVGVLGFLHNPVLGLFQVNLLHNLVHVTSGALTLLAARHGIGAMRTWGKAFGLFYLALSIAGSTLPDGDLMGVLHLSLSDNLLHLALSGFFLYYGLLAPPRL